MTPSLARETSLVLWACIVLFAARVIGQLEAVLVGPGWLPDMEAWYSGLLPYPLLLPLQIAILMLMAVVAWNPRVRHGLFARANPRGAQALRLLAYVYFVVMVLRLLVNVTDNGIDFWREGAIPVAFHWVLALFLLVCGRGVPPDHEQEDDEAHDIPHGDVPSLAQPLACGPGFREQV